MRKSESAIRLKVQNNNLNFNCINFNIAYDY
jgi:hypothetical protein